MPPLVTAPFLDVINYINSSSSSDSWTIFFPLTFLYTLCWLYSNPSMVLPAAINCSVIMAFLRSLLHWFRMSSSYPSPIHSSSPSATNFNTLSIDFSVGAFRFKTKKDSFRCCKISRTNSFEWKDCKRSWESDRVKIIRGVDRGESTNDLRASLKSLINSKRRAWKIFRHSRKPLITITLRCLFYVCYSIVFTIGAWYKDVFLAVKLEPLILWAFELLWAFALILKKWMRFSRSLGYDEKL